VHPALEQRVQGSKMSIIGLVSCIGSDWRSALVIVEAETVIDWHRKDGMSGGRSATRCDS
jgi:hypothetical protein